MRQRLSDYFKWVRPGDGELFSKGLLVFIDQSGYSLISLLTSVLLARACGKETFGVFVLSLTFIYFAKVVQRSLVSVPFSVVYPRLQGDEQRRFLGSALIFHLGITLLLAAGLWVAMGAARLSGSIAGLGGSVGYYAAVLVCMLTADLVRMVLLSQFRYARCFVIGLVTQATLAGLLIGLFAAGRLDIRSACAVLIAGYGLFVLTGGIPLKGYAIFEQSAWKRDMQTHWRQGKWILSGTFVNYAGAHLLPWITLLWWDSGVVAVAGVLGMAASFLRPVMQSMIHFLIPRFSETLSQKGLSEVRRQTAFLVQLSAAAGLALCAGLYLQGDLLVGMVYGDAYRGYAGTLTLFSAAAFLRAANAPVRSLLTAMGLPRQLVTSSAYATVVCVVTAFLWIPKHGATGYACAYMVSNLTNFSINLIQAFYGKTHQYPEPQAAAA